MEEKLNIIKNNKGFIAALDQSGGSSGKTLERYGISKDKYQTEEEMFDLIHEMRTRVITAPAFNNKHILGTILFYKTMESKIEGKYTSDYLWENKHIVSFLKVDKGLREEENNVKLMKDISDIDDQLEEVIKKHVFGTKMRSVIYNINEKGIENIVNQQFKYAEIICNKGLVPIIEPEVDINSPNKKECEAILLNKILERLDSWNKDNKIMFKFTIPTTPNLYDKLLKNDAVIKIVALSGGYSQDKACELLSQNHNMVASFSRALLQDLNVNQTDDEFNKALDNSITKIYNASIK